MRAVTLLNLAQVQDPVVRSALDEIQKASQDNVISDVAQSGAVLSTIENASADEFPYFTSATTVDLTALTAFSRSMLALGTEGDWLTALGGAPSGSYLVSSNNLGDVADAAMARTNLDVTATGDDTTYAFRANDLSDLASAAIARTNLGVAIGSDVLAFDAQLTSNIRQNSQNVNYTTVLTDGEKHIYHPSADTTARTWTIDSNADVAYPIGTPITFINDVGAGVVTLAMNSDTLVWSPSGSTGSRSLAAGGIATAIKIGTTRWMISGSGLS